MLIYLKIENFLSFENVTEFSFEPTANKILSDYYITEPIPNSKALNLSLLFGPNGSGKSNLAKAFQFLKEFVLNDTGNFKSASKFVSFAAGTKPNSSFEICFIHQKTKFKYCLELCSTHVIKEELYFYPGVKPALIFHRSLHEDEYDLKFGNKINIERLTFKTITKHLLYSESFFYAYRHSDFSNALIQDALDWFNTGIEVLQKNYNIDDIKKQLKKDIDLKKEVITFLQKVGFSINDIIFQPNIQNAEEFKQKISDPYLSYFDKEKLLKGSNHISFEYKTISTNGQESYYIIPEELESRGLFNVMYLAIAIIKMTRNNSLLVIDGSNSNIHPHVMRFLIRDFLLHRGVYSETQLLIILNDISLLSERDMLRKDAIWFMEKLSNGASDLYSMADFNIRKELSYYNAYNLGKFGATPNLD